jgi:hypothetical protein
MHGSFVPDSVVDFQKGEAYVAISIGMLGDIEAPKVRKTWTIQYSKP